MQETIDAVRAAEKKAEELEKQTRLDCKRIVAEAKEKAAAEHDRRIGEACDAAEQARQAAQERSRQRTEEAEHDAQDQVRALEEQAADKRDDTIQKLLATLL